MAQVVSEKGGDPGGAEAEGDVEENRISADAGALRLDGPKSLEERLGYFTGLGEHLLDQGSWQADERRPVGYHFR